MKSIVVVLCFLILVPAGRADAETSRELKQGDRIRVHTADSSDQYILQSIGPDTLNVVSRDGKIESNIAVAGIEEIEVRVPRSKGSGVLWGLLIGCGVGGTFGIIYAVATDNEVDTDCGSPGDICNETIKGARAVGYATAFAVPFMALGAVIGASSPGERWERVEYPGSVSIGPGRDGAVVVQYTFSF